jgi:tetratricopeptide (TPR) repeat protein
MRPRSRRKTRSTIPLDLRAAYLGTALTECVFAPIALTPLSEFDLEIDFCEQILRVNPAYGEALSVLGEAYTRRGDYVKGLDIDLKLSQLRPESGVVHYNLACSYALTGHVEESFDALKKSVELGYRDLEHIRNDRDLEILRKDARYAALLEMINELEHSESSSEK